MFGKRTVIDIKWQGGNHPFHSSVEYTKTSAKALVKTLKKQGATHITVKERKPDLL